MEKNFYKKIKKVFYLCLIILLFSIFARNLVLAEGNTNQAELSNTTVDDSRTVYKLLAPLKSSSGTVDSFNTAKDCAFGEYLNVMIDIFIGIAAVLAMLMIVIGGIEYMTSELASSKESGKSKITQAVLGLLLVLGAWLILNTLNPKLLSLCLNNLPKGTPTVIKDFRVSGGLRSTSNRQSYKINFNKEAYPAAKFASEKTGVSAAFILAIFSQETTSGVNTGSCNYANANMMGGQLTPLKEIATKLGRDYTTINMSCKAGASNFGGAIGLTQFLPGTWIGYDDQAQAILGHYPDPWNTQDALLMSALFLKDLGGASNQREAACKYFAGPARSCSYTPGTGAYGDEVMERIAVIQKQIDQAIADGKISSSVGSW